MADNDQIELQDGQLTDVASDDIAGVKHPRVKVEWGADGVAQDVSAANPLPVRLSDGTTQSSVRDLSNSNPIDVAIVDASGNQVTAFGGTGGTSMVDDAAFSVGATSITPIGAMFDDASPDSVNEGDAGIPRMSANRNLYITVRDAAGNERGLNIDANGALSIGAIIPGVAATSLGKAEDAVHASGDTGVMSLAVQRNTPTSTAADGDYVPLITDSSGRLHMAPAAAARTSDSVSIAHQTDRLMQNLTERTPTFAVIDAATSGDNTIVAAQGASNKIRVHQLVLVASGTVTVRFESGASGTALTGQMTLTTNTGFVLPFSPVGWFETAANTLLNLELSAAQSVDGCLVYTIAT